MSETTIETWMRQDSEVKDSYQTERTKTIGIEVDVPTTGELDISSEDLKQYLQDIFFKERPKERKVYGMRGCLTVGWVDFNDFTFHCGDERCASCNHVKEIFQEAMVPNMTITIGNERETEHINEDSNQEEGIPEELSELVERRLDIFIEGTEQNAVRDVSK